MPADLERMFSSLRADTDGASIPAPDAVRRRGDRRSRDRAVVGLIAIAVLVAGTAFGTRQLLAGPVPPAPQPGVTSPSKPLPSPSPTPSPTSAASPTETVEETYPVGSPIPVPEGCEEVLVYPYDGPAYAGDPLPASRMLRASDWGRCYAMTHDRAGYVVHDPAKVGGAPAPDVCSDNAPYDADGDRVAGRVRAFDGGPEIGGYESLTRYRSGAGAAFLEEIRDRVARCATFIPTFQVDDEPMWHARVMDTDFTGDESLLIYVGTGTNGKGYPGWYIGVARVGDLVTVVEPSMDLGGDLAYTREMTRKAVNRL